MQTLVSVIVPVYNPGPYMEPCLRSLLGQSMAPEDLELIFVDDGSTDDTPARLQLLAAEHSQVRVISIPNSGWPGKPRNVGTDAALGEYVMFVDQDDALEPQSLERMYTLGAANHADVVLGKVISDFRGVHHNLYREQRPSCDVFDGDLMNSLTPHKMLRTEFLREHGIRYPEGPRRLEDQLFMTKAYFAASAASIVGNYVCYRYLRRPDGRNAGSKRIEPAAYYTNLREVLDVVDAYTAVGPQRDDFYRRFLRTEVLGRLSAPNLLRSPPDYLTSLLHEIRTLVSERFPLSVDAGLGAALRGQAALARFGTLWEIGQQGEAVNSINATTTLTGLRLRGARAVEIDVEARLRLGDQPLMLERAPQGWWLPRSLTGPGVSDAQRLIEPVSEMRGDVVIRHRQLLDEWFVPAPLLARIEVDGDRAEVVWSGTATVDPGKAAGGEPLRRGLHDFIVRVQAFGVTRSTRLGADRAPGLAPLPLLVDRSRRIHQIYDTDLDNLSLNVDAKRHWLATALRSARFVDRPDGKPALDLGAVWRIPPKTVSLILTPIDGGTPVEWTMQPQRSRSRRWVGSAGRQRLRMKPGRYRATLTMSSTPRETELDETFVLDAQRRRLWFEDSARSVLRRSRRATRRVLGRVLPRT